MKEKDKKKQIIKISVFITSIFVIFLSVTYAFINQTLTGTKRQVITAGNLSLELQEDENNLTITDAMPMYDEVGMIQEAFTFRLVNKIDVRTNYIVKLEKIIVADPLDESLVKYGLTKDEEVTIDFVSNIEEGVIDTGVIEGNQTINYSLRLWIDSSVEDESLISRKSLSYKLNIEATQNTVLADSIIKKREKFSSTEMFWNYKNNITSVVFENTVKVPQTIAEDKRWDVSANEDGSVMAYLEPVSEDSSDYKLHIQGNGKIIANEDSSYFFSDFSKLSTIEGLEYFDTSSVVNMSNMFYRCRVLVNLDVSNFNTSSVTDMSRLFYDCNSLTNLDLSNFDTSNVTNMSYMFYRCRVLVNLDVSNFDTSSVTNMSYMFCDCSNLTSLDVSSFNTIRVTNMSYMFNNCSSLTSLVASSFDTSNVTNMSYMFCDCSNLTSLDVSSFNTIRVTNMDSMFSRCGSLTSLVVSSFNTTRVTNMSSMFGGCSSLTSLNLSSFYTRYVTNMASMFAGCSGLTNLDLNNFDTSNVTSMSAMFAGCSSLTSLVVSSFNTTRVTNMFMMFSSCSSLTSLDLSSFDITKVTSMSNMFRNVKNNCLITVKNATTKTWVLDVNSKLTNIVVKSA